MRKLFIAMLLVVGISSFAMAHSGGTDSNGCHRNHKTGGYHCH
ncbi:YHYH domain-containing protein [Hahella ganghwensis]